MTAPARLLAGVLLLFAGCSAHEHLHLHGQVHDLTKPAAPRGEEQPTAARVEVWATTAEGQPTRRLALTNRYGSYDTELQPGEHEGGIGVRKEGYNSEWWPLSTFKWKASERAAHTKRIDLHVTTPAATRKAAKRRRGRPMLKPPAHAPHGGHGHAH